jgi:hypothetical protein
MVAIPDEFEDVDRGDKYGWENGSIGVYVAPVTISVQGGGSRVETCARSEADAFAVTVETGKETLDAKPHWLHEWREEADAVEFATLVVHWLLAAPGMDSFDAQELQHIGGEYEMVETDWSIPPVIEDKGPHEVMALLTGFESQHIEDVLEADYRDVD